MFLYYLIDLRSQPFKITLIYYSDSSQMTKAEILEKWIGKVAPQDAEKILYSKIPVTEICGFEHLKEDQQGHIYFFYLGGYDFYYAVGHTVEEARNCLE